MKFLNITKVYLKSFNKVKHHFFINKFLIFNYIIFFYNLKKMNLMLISFKKFSLEIFFLNFLKKKMTFLLRNPNLMVYSIKHSLFKFIQIYNRIQIRINYSLYISQMYKLNLLPLINLMSYLSLTIINLPVKLKKYTILKSPHIFKKFRDQYQINHYTSCLSFFILDDFEFFQNIVNNMRIKSFIEVSFDSFDFFLLND